AHPRWVLWPQHLFAVYLDRRKTGTRTDQLSTQIIQYFAARSRGGHDFQSSLSFRITDLATAFLTPSFTSITSRLRARDIPVYKSDCGSSVSTCSTSQRTTTALSIPLNA